MRLVGTGDLALGYASSSGAARDGILIAYRSLDRVISAHFITGGMMQGIAFLLVAWAALSFAPVPRWLALWLFVPGVTALTTETLAAVGRFSLPVLLFHVLGFMELNVSIAAVYWRPRAYASTAAAPGRPGELSAPSPSPRSSGASSVRGGRAPGGRG